MSFIKVYDCKIEFIEDKVIEIPCSNYYFQVYALPIINITLFDEWQRLFSKIMQEKYLEKNCDFT